MGKELEEKCPTCGISRVKTEFGMEQDGTDETIKTFDKLWAEGLISEDPVKAGQIMGVDGAYLDSFIQWYVELGDLEYTPWIEKYQ